MTIDEATIPADPRPSRAAAGRKARLARRSAYLLAAAAIGLALLASGTPSPLYAIYRALWGFSPVVLTLVYATYAFGVLTTLLLAGRLSDDVGRRPVLVGALATLIGASILFMVADSVLWLFVARAIQGLATGLVLAAASAALIDLHPRGDPAAAGLTNGVASAAGMALGVLASATIVELAPAPRVLAYVVPLALFAIALVAAVRMPEPVPTRSRPRLRPQRPSVPPPTRRAFVLAALAVMSSWSILGLFLSLGPQLAAFVFHTPDTLVAGASVFAFAAPAAVSQLAFARTAPWAGAAGGSVALAAGMVAVVLAASTGSAALFLAGVIGGGAGFGVVFLGGLRALSAAIPGRQRAAVMSSFYLVAYASLSLPAILAGVLVTPLGLRSTFEIFGSVIAGLGLAAAVQAWRLRPSAEPVVAGCAAGTPA